MKYIEYDGKKISKLSLGTVQFGIDYGVANKEGKPKDEEVEKIITYLFDNGINAFDTATSYGDSEERIGNVLKYGRLLSLQIFIRIFSKMQKRRLEVH